MVSWIHHTSADQICAIVRSVSRIEKPLPHICSQANAYAAEPLSIRPGPTSFLPTTIEQKWTMAFCSSSFSKAERYPFERLLHAALSVFGSLHLATFPTLSAAKQATGPVMSLRWTFLNNQKSVLCMALGLYWQLDQRKIPMLG